MLDMLRIIVAGTLLYGSTILVVSVNEVEIRGGVGAAIGQAA